jgi:hypothetical protein
MLWKNSRTAKRRSLHLIDRLRQPLLIGDEHFGRDCAIEILVRLRYRVQDNTPCNIPFSITSIISTQQKELLLRAPYSVTWARAELNLADNLHGLLHPTLSPSSLLHADTRESRQKLALQARSLHDYGVNTPSGLAGDVESWSSTWN